MFLSVRLLKFFCLPLMMACVCVMHAMPPIYKVVEYDATEVQTMQRNYTSGLVGEAFQGAGEHIVSLVGSVTFACTKRNFKCLNSTHDRYFEACTPQRMSLEYSVVPPVTESLEEGGDQAPALVQGASCVLKYACFPAAACWFVHRVSSHYPTQKIKRVAQAGICWLSYGLFQLYCYENVPDHTPITDMAFYLSAVCAPLVIPEIFRYYVPQENGVTGHL